MLTDHKVVGVVLAVTVAAVLATVVVSLSLNATNWNPSNASDFIALGWDYDGQVIDTNRVVEVMLFLSVSPSIEGISTFSFDIVVVGSG